MLRIVPIAVAALVLGACQSSPSAPAQGSARLFKGMGDHRRTVTTSSPEAQKFFDQGLVWVFSFNHDEAIRSFREATRLDVDCAMAWWGIALANGPHINNPAMDEEHSRAAWEAHQAAQGALEAAGGTPQERALITALGARYAWPAPDDRSGLDRAYARAMKWAHESYPEDNDIATLYAESLMDLRPWDLWATDGTPRPETPEIIAVLERILASDPMHPGANHLYIHAVEASPEPGKATASADRLRTLVPASGHMVHMPAHIYARTGRWSEAAEQNRIAIKTDAAYRRLSPHQEFYRFYMAHNHQFLAFVCMMQGRSAEAIKAARAMEAGIPPEFIRDAAEVVDGLLPLTLEALMRFGRWEEILREPRPPEYLPIKTAVWRFTRAIALVNTGRLEEARAEREEFRSAAAAVPPGAMVINSPAETVMQIAGHVLDGELAFFSGDTDAAVSHLRLGIEAEDTLRYDEPPDWMVPVRHTLGAILVSAGRHAEAEAAYREDLARWPENGWSLYGLAQSLRAQGSPEAAEIEARFARVWAEADVKITSTCACVR